MTHKLDLKDVVTSSLSLKELAKVLAKGGNAEGVQDEKEVAYNRLI
jgi:hypothetical protein